MNIEDTKPIDALASRIWSGTHWHYPHIEKMVAELTALRASLAGAERIKDAAKKVLRASSEVNDAYISGAKVSGKLGSKIVNLAMDSEMLRSTLTPPPTKEAPDAR